MFRPLFVTFIIFALAISAIAQPVSLKKTEINLLEEINPFDPNIEETLKKFDQEEEARTGQPSHLESSRPLWSPSCVRETCDVWAQVVKSEQKLYLYVDGELKNTFDVSTGDEDHETPNFDRHPNGRVYDQYSSSAYPGGDYQGLGNMPYAVFISGGFAIHGTTVGNFKYLGNKASHGCVRLHPDNAFVFNRLVREHGVDNVWITVQD